MEKIFRHVLLLCSVAGFISIGATQVQEPCDFLDTVNITSGHLDQHGNILYDGTIYKKGLYSEFDYVVENKTVKIKVEPHIRGCICSFKPCIRICCVGDASGKPFCVHSDTLTVPTQDDEVEIDLKGQTYGVLVGLSCGETYKLEPKDYTEDRWFFMVSTSK